MARPLQKERSNRSAEKKDLVFHPYNITPETAHTAVLLLDSKEPEVLCQTLRALTKFSSQDMSNREVLFNLDAIPLILPHTEHNEMNIRRFALKALAQLCQLPKGPEQVIVDPQNLRRVAQLLARNEDVFVLEFASLVLAELTKEPLGCEQLISANILSVLFNRMKNSLDPDVQKNCLQTLLNVIEDPVTVGEVTKSPQFQWPGLLALIQSTYLAIQHATLKCIEILVGRHNDANIQKSFKASTGINDLCDVLESYEFRDIHTEVLSVLKTYVETEENASHVYQSGCVTRLLTYLEMALPVMKPHCLNVLTKMSYTANGRTALFETGTDLVFCHHLLSTNADLIADAAMGIANMCKLIPSAMRMADTFIMDAIGSILGDENAPWFDIRMNTLLAMSVLCRLIPKAAYAAVDQKIFTSLRNIIRKPNPLEAQRLAMQVYINLLNYEVSTKAMTTSDFFSEILLTLQKPDFQLKILAANLLTGLTVEENGKHFFTLRRGEEVVSSNLLFEHVGLRTALCQLIASSVTCDSADTYLGLGTIHYMLENKKARYVISAWEVAIDAILSRHPSAKLAYTGRLGINDFTEEGFYVMKRLGDNFATIQEIVDSSGRDPVLIAIFQPSPFERSSSYDIRSPYPNSQSKININTPESRVSRLRLPIPDDENLRDYLTRLKIWFGDPSKSLHFFEIEHAHYEVRYREKCSEVSSSLKARAQLLGEFVAEQMCGLTQERDCSFPSVEIHLADIMMESRLRVIGLGFVKCGGPLERAVLYKVLADRVGLPCALYRATSAHAWVEVAVPELDPEEELEAEEKYPAGLLRTNYVVDLMEVPGRLIPVASKDAERICGPVCTPLYVALRRPVICKCKAKPKFQEDSVKSSS